MSSRPIVSYDDITLPYDQPEDLSNNTPSSSHSAQAPPPKKRKRNNQKTKRREDATAFKKSNPNLNPQNTEFMKHLSNTNHYSVKIGSLQPNQETEAEVDGQEQEGEYYEEEEEEEESRELTHQEIWDDSALVDAWEAAMEEYATFHGPEKDWKKEPVKKSPLWYNIPIDPSKNASKNASNKAITELPGVILSNDDAETDSKPLDFDTFVPTHDPTLDIPPVPPTTTTTAATTTNAVPGASSYIPDSSGPMVSQDEAFQRALSATYWSGYWTAMYHNQRQLTQQQPPQVGPSTTHDVPVTTAEEELAEAEGQEHENQYEGEEKEMDDEGEEDEFVSTQR